MIKNILKISLIVVFLFLANETFACFEFNNLSIRNQTDNNKAEIIKLQILLKSVGAYTGPITGYYGSLTEAVIKEIQKSENLPATGTIDARTKESICFFFYKCPFNANLKRNDITPRREIESLQAFLSFYKEVYARKLVTGFYGNLTEEAVKNFQRSFNLSQTGQVDESTRRALCQAFDTFTNQELTKSTPKTATATPRATTSTFQSICIPFPREPKTNQPVTFISQILGGVAPYTYQWSGDVSGNNRTITNTFTREGSYAVNLKVTDKNGNVSESRCNISIGEGLLGRTADDRIAFPTLDIEVERIERVGEDILRRVEEVLSPEQREKSSKENVVKEEIEIEIEKQKEVDYKRYADDKCRIQTLTKGTCVGDIFPPTDYSCSQITGRCVIVPYATGKYATLEECNKDCVKKDILTRYSCNLRTRACEPSILGMYASFSNCMRDCYVTELKGKENLYGRQWEYWKRAAEYPEILFSSTNPYYSVVQGDPNKTPDLVPFVSSVRGIVSSGDVDHVFSDPAMLATGNCTEIQKTGGGVWDLGSKNNHIAKSINQSYQGLDLLKGDSTTPGNNHCFLYGEAIIEAGIANIGSMPAGLHTFAAVVGDPLNLPGDGLDQGVKLTHHLYPVTYTQKNNPSLKDRIRNIWDYGYVRRSEERMNPYKHHYGIEYMGEFQWPKSLDSNNIFYVPGISAGNIFKTWFRFRCQDNKVHRIYFVADPPQYADNSPQDICNPSYTQGQTDGKIMQYNILTRYSGNKSKVNQPTRWSDKFNGEYTSFLPLNFIDPNANIVNRNQMDSKYFSCMYNAPLAYNKREEDHSSWSYKNNIKLYSGPGDCVLPDFRDLKKDEVNKYTDRFFDDLYTSGLNCSDKYWTGNSHNNHFLYLSQNRPVSSVNRPLPILSNALRTSLPDSTVSSARPSFTYLEPRSCLPFDLRYEACPKREALSINGDGDRKSISIGMVYETFNEWNNMAYIDIQCNCFKDKDGKPFCFGPELKEYVSARETP